MHWKVKALTRRYAHRGSRRHGLRHHQDHPLYEKAKLLAAQPRTPAGYRDYPPAAIKRLDFIKDAQAAGLSRAEIRDVPAVRDAGQAPCRHVADLIDSHLEQIERPIAELVATCATLEALRQRAQGTDPAACDAGGICTILAPAPRHPGPDR